jgi:uncharacterized protein YbaR (Trm112 family)
MALSAELLAILVCPGCKGELLPVDDGSGLVCEPCRLRYPVREDIPVMLVEEAEKIREK